jgi:hypothetical protein
VAERATPVLQLLGARMRHDVRAGEDDLVFGQVGNPAVEQVAVVVEARQHALAEPAHRGQVLGGQSVHLQQTIHGHVSNICLHLHPQHSCANQFNVLIVAD